MALRFVRRIIVVRPMNPKRSFPIDMMRYDQCAPANESEAHKIECMTIGEGRAEEVKLHRYAPHSGGKASKDTGALSGNSLARWRSFGWEVVSDDLDEVCK